MFLWALELIVYAATGIQPAGQSHSQSASQSAGQPAGKPAGQSGQSDSYLLSQELNFKLFGFPYLVGTIKFSHFFPFVIGEVRLVGRPVSPKGKQLLLTPATCLRGRGKDPQRVGACFLTMCCSAMLFLSACFGSKRT